MCASVSSRPEDGDPLRIWEVERLWKLAADLPAKYVPIETLTDLDRVAWHGRPENWGRLTCREVAEHGRRIDEANLSFPLLLLAQGELMDGFHRLAKAYLLGAAEVLVVQFQTDPEPDRVRAMPPWLRQTIAPPS